MILLASSVDMPEIDLRPIQMITVTDAIAQNIQPHPMIPWSQMDPTDPVMVVACEDDLHELMIQRINEWPGDCPGKTYLTHLYTVSFRYTPKRGVQLLVYLRMHLPAGEQGELWHVFLGDDTSVCTFQVTIDALTQDMLASILDHAHPGFCWNQSMQVNA